MPASTGATVWLDVTALAHCSTRPPTGIPRTALNIFHALREQGYVNLRFCRIDDLQAGYYEVFLEELLEKFPLVAGEVRRAGDKAIVSCRSPLRALARQCLPRPLRAVIGKTKDRILEGIHIGIRACRACRKRFKRSEPPVMLFSPGDVLLNLGATWLTPGASEWVAVASREVGFSVVTLIYDLIPLLLPQFFRRSLCRKFQKDFEPWARQATLLLAISHNTREDVLRHAERVGIRPPPVEVVRLSEEIPANPNALPGPPAAFPGDGRPFVLCVGTLEVRKNHYLLYQVWRRLLVTGVPPRLILVGGPGWLSGDLIHQLDHDPVTSDHIIQLSGCHDGALRWLYQHCLFTVYPSHYEGWGLPVAESLAFGKYCIASNSSSLPEIAPDLVELHAPDDVPGWVQKVERALDPSFRLAQEARIRQLYRRTSWTDTAREIVAHVERHVGPVFQHPPLRASA